MTTRFTTATADRFVVTFSILGKNESMTVRASSASRAREIVRGKVSANIANVVAREI